MALSRGKQMTQTPSGSNIRVNVPDYASILNAPINVFAEKAKLDEQRTQLDFKREGINFSRQEAIKNAEIQSLNNQKKEIIKADKEQQKLFEKALKKAQDLKEAEAKALADRIEAANEIAFLKHSTAMTNFAWELELKHPNNPDAIVSQMEEYWNKVTKNKENAVWLKDEKRFYKFQEKYSQLFRSAVGESTKKFDTFQEDQHWGSLTNYAEKLITNTEIHISRIESEADIPQYLEQITQDINTLQNHMSSYDEKWGYKMTRTPEEMSQLMYNLISARDTKFISHIINKFVLGDTPNEYNISMAKAILGHIEQNKLPNAFRGDPVHPHNAYSKKGMYEVLSMISDYTNSSQKGTIDQYTPKDRNIILDNINTSIENAENEYKIILREEQLKFLSNMEETTSRFLHKDSKEWVGGLNSQIVSEEYLNNIILMRDGDNIVTDTKKVNEILKLQKTKKDFGQIVTDVMMGNLSTEEITNRINAVDLEELGYSKGDINAVYEVAVEQAFGGDQFDPINLFSNVMKDGAFITDQSMEDGIAMMKKLNYWHPKLTQVLDGFANSEFTNPKDAEYLVGFAKIKNRVLATNDAINLPEDYSLALDKVVAEYDLTKSYSQAVLKWKEDINEKYSDMKAINESVDTWWTGKSDTWWGGSVTGSERTRHDLMKVLTKAINREDWTHIRGLIDLITPKRFETTDLDNLVKNKNTFGLFADMYNFIMLGDAMDIANAKDINFTISESAGDWFQNHVKNKMSDFLKGVKDPDESDMERVYNQAVKDAIKSMSNNKRFKFSTILYDPATPYGFVLTENRPEDEIMNGALASDPRRILTNATAFVGKKLFKQKDQNELAFSVFGNTADYRSHADKNALFRDFMGMAENGRVKLFPVQDQKDLNNPAYLIMLDVDGDGIFIAFTENGKDVEWTPNTQYTDSPFGLTHDQVAKKWATDLIDGKTGIGSYNLRALADHYDMDLTNINPQDRTDMINILTKMIQSDSTFRDIFSSLLFPNDDVSGGDANIDTISEFHSKAVLEFDDYRKSVNDEVNYTFDTDQEAFVFGHKSKYEQNLFEMEEGIGKVEEQKKNTAIATTAYDELYGIEKSNIIIPPKYKFIVTDIIEAYPDGWQVLVGEGTRFHDAMMREDYLDAGDELENMKSYFNQGTGQHPKGQLQRLNDLINYWGMSFNKP